MRIRFLSMFLFASITTTQMAHSQNYALVIGNKDYHRSVGELSNPIKDIRLVGAALHDAGFIVKYVENASRSEMLVAVREHAQHLQAAGDGAIGFLYYSGHGAANPSDRRNYLIPVTLKDPSAPTFWYDAVGLKEIRDELSREAPNAAHIVVIDACRNELRLGRGGKNFVPIATWPSIFVAFSTGEGEIATDGNPAASAGPYALALEHEIRRARRLLVPVLFERVRSSFRERFDAQFPTYVQGLNELVYIDGMARKREENDPPSGCSELFAASLWAEIERAQSPGLTTEFLRHCRGTASSDLAKEWLVAHRLSVLDDTQDSPSPTTEEPVSLAFAQLISELESEDSATRRSARSSLVSGGLNAIDEIIKSVQLNRVTRSYRLQLGAAVVFAEFLRSEKSQRKAVSQLLTQDDINWLVSLSAHPDRTMRVYASEFLFDLGDPRVVQPATELFPTASSNGKYNLALVLKGATPFVPKSDTNDVERKIFELRSSSIPKTTALLDDAISLMR
jgi:hypothetical protein